MSKRNHFLKLLLLLGFILFSTNSQSDVASMDNNVITWAGCGITKKAFMAELAKAYEKKTGIKMELHGGGATHGIRSVSALKMDMGGSCRMTLPELEGSERHVTLHPVAWDALAVIANPKNPLQNLTTEQIKKIYMGKITNWKDLGGADAPIELYVRKGKISGVGYAIRQYLFQDGGTEFVASQVVKSSGPLEKAVESNPNAIGITGVSSARKRNVKIISIDGKSPTYDNVKNGSYGMYRPLYLVTGPKPSAKVKDFIAFANSKEGREIVRGNGTVPYRDALNLMSKMVIYGFGVR